MSFEIQEVNGKLFKITNVPIDKFNVRRRAVPLTEDEYEKIVQAVQKNHSDELKVVERFKGSKSLPKSLEIDEQKILVEEPKRGTPVQVKTETRTIESETPPKFHPQTKRFRVSGD